MKNPYEHLYIYYFEGLPRLDPDIETNEAYLGNWIDDDISFLFFSKPSDKVVDQICLKNPNARLADTYQMTGEQWHGDRIEPYYIHNLHICPPWERPALQNDEDVQVVLDPGVVFGTGRHQTTEDCLYLIHRLCTKHNIDSVLDIGTGTGLLSVGAAALGSQRVFACDYNYLAVKTAYTNVCLNQFEDRILAFQAQGEQMVSIPCDLMVANIHYDIMKQIIEQPALLKKRWVILSGLLMSETTKIIDSLRKKGVRILERRCPDGVWNTLLCQNKKA